MKIPRVLFSLLMIEGLIQAKEASTKNFGNSAPSEDNLAFYPIRLDISLNNLHCNVSIVSREKFSKYLIVYGHEFERVLESNRANFKLTLPAYNTPVYMIAHAVVAEGQYPINGFTYKDLVALHRPAFNSTYTALKCVEDEGYSVLKIALPKIHLYAQKWLELRKNSSTTVCPEFKIAMLNEAYTSVKYTITPSITSAMKDMVLTLSNNLKTINVAFESSETIANGKVINLEEKKMKKMKYINAMTTNVEDYAPDNAFSVQGLLQLPILLFFQIERQNYHSDSFVSTSAPNQFCVSILPKSNETYLNNYGRAIKKQIIESRGDHVVVISYTLMLRDGGDYEFRNSTLMSLNQPFKLF